MPRTSRSAPSWRCRRVACCPLLRPALARLLALIPNFRRCRLCSTNKSWRCWLMSAPWFAPPRGRNFSNGRSRCRRISSLTKTSRRRCRPRRSPRTDKPDGRAEPLTRSNRSTVETSPLLFRWREPTSFAKGWPRAPLSRAAIPPNCSRDSALQPNLRLASPRCRTCSHLTPASR
jgi:hypothetical protein